MNIFLKTCQELSLESFQQTLSILKSGGIIAHATDTCYGFACDIFNKEALKRLYKLKKMSFRKPVSILVSSLAMARRYGYFSKKTLLLAKKYWPGPLTIIVKRKKSLPSFLNPHSETIGIRIPDHKLSIDLVKQFKSPLTTTSANISGKPSPYAVLTIQKQFKKYKLKPDFILDSGRLEKNPPSTLIKMNTQKIKIIRQGRIFIS